MFTRETLQAAFDLLDHLQSKGIQCIIAGGCARDIFFGVKPKDVDIVVAGSSMESIAVILAEANVAARACHMYRQGYSDDRIMGCFKLSGAPIDIVLYRTECVSQAIDAFDFNLNQFAIVGTRLGIEGAAVRYMGLTPWTSLTEVRSDTTPERRERMLTKFLELAPRRAPDRLSCPVGGEYGPF